MDLPRELILEISEYAGISCYICGKKLCPWTIIGYSGIYFCRNECYVQAILSISIIVKWSTLSL